MTASLPSLGLTRDRVPRAIARALRASALGRIPGPEREWARRIEERRQRLLDDPVVTEPVFDPGAPGPKGDLGMLYQPVRVEVASLLMSLPAVWCTLLMRLVRELAPRRCLELGTAFGVSGAYQAAALELNGSGSLTTLEGSSEWAQIAERGFSELGLARVQTLVGPISETFEEAARGGPFDYAFIDAEHAEEAILGYFDTMLPDLAGEAVVVFDDIDWSEGTWTAWCAVAAHKRVFRSVALGRMGIVALSDA